jgi:hypothetical protein
MNLALTPLSISSKNNFIENMIIEEPNRNIIPEGGGLILNNEGLTTNITEE